MIAWTPFLVLLLNAVLIESSPHSRKSRSFVCPSFSTNQNTLCTDNPSYPYFGTKTAYDEAFRFMKSLGLPAEELPSGYTPTLFYYFGRHGIRYPDAEEINTLNALSGNISALMQSSDGQNTKLCAEIVKKLKNFKSSWITSDDNHVTETGTKELAGIGSRFKKLVPRLLNPQNQSTDMGVQNQSIDIGVQNQSIDIGVSDKIRTTESGRGFMRGVYGEGYKGELPLPSPKYSVTMYHKACRDARKGRKVEKGKIVKKFRKSDILTSLMKTVLGRLGLPSDEMTFKQFKHLHELCSYHLSINGTSVWCDIFTPADLKLLEYYDDIHDYYAVHNDKSMVRSACAVMSELFSFINSSITGRNESSTILRFSHSGAIRPLLAYLGLFHNFGSNKGKDHADYCLNGPIQREWRTSFISPFAANVAFILLKKDQQSGSPVGYNGSSDSVSGGSVGYNGSSDPVSQFKVLTLVQEVPVKVGGCKELLCPLNEFIQSFSESVRKCNVQAICSRDLDQLTD